MIRCYFCWTVNSQDVGVEGVCYQCHTAVCTDPAMGHGSRCKVSGCYAYTCFQHVCKHQATTHPSTKLEACFPDLVRYYGESNLKEFEKLPEIEIIKLLRQKRP